MSGFTDCLEFGLYIGLFVVLASCLYIFIYSKEKTPRTVEDINRAISAYTVILVIAIMLMIINLIDVALQTGEPDMSRVGMIVSVMFAIYALVTNNVYRLEDKLEQLKQSEKNNEPSKDQ